MHVRNGFITNGINQYNTEFISYLLIIFIYLCCLTIWQNDKNEGQWIMPLPNGHYSR